MILKPKLITKIEPGHWASKGLVGGCLFNEGGGDLAYDISGNGNHGTPVSDVSWVAGRVGPSLDFSGGYINIPAPDAPFLGAITIIVYAKIDTGGGYRHFAGKHAGNGANSNPFDFRTTNAATPSLVLIRAKDAGSSVWDGPSVTLGQWKQYAITQSGLLEESATFYINGFPTVDDPPPTTSGAPTGSGADIRIGDRADSAVTMDGQIDHVFFYNRVLTASEMNHLFINPFQMFKVNK